MCPAAAALVRDVAFAGFLRTPLGLAVVVDHDIARRPEQVAAQAARDLRRLLPDPQDRLLDDVVGEVRIPGRR